MNTRWGCSCGNEIDLAVRTSRPPTCTGSVRKHSARNMTVISTNNPKGATMATTKKDTTKKDTTKKADQLCQCNAVLVEGSEDTYESCGRLTRGRFAPGHDAKLKSALITCAVAGRPYKVKGQKGQDAEKVAADLGWSRFTTRAIEVAAEKAAKAEAKAAAAAEAKAAKAKDAAEAKAAKAKAAAEAKAAKAEAAKAKAAKAAEAKARKEAESGT